MDRNLRRLLAALSAVASPVAFAGSFVYEGRLDDLGQPANGRYDLQLTAFGHEHVSAKLAAPITFEGVAVQDGRFRLDVELPLANADAVWLEVAVRESGAGAFSAIPGRSKAIAAPLIGACWSTTGDSGSNPATNFLGTTDGQPLVLRVNGQQALRIEPDAASPSLIGGSGDNAVSASVSGATIAGGGTSGFPNSVTDVFGTVGGGASNRAGNESGTVIDRAYATVGGGFGNAASGYASTVGGGDGNTASASFASTVGGGVSNTASGERSTVGGGASNTAAGDSSTVGGGSSNTASGGTSTVGGGGNNTASGGWSTVSGGLGNCAGGNFSWAGGRLAKVRPASDPSSGSCSLLTYPGGVGDQGTFVWADSQNFSFVSTGSNQFLVRALGGALITGASDVNDPAGNRLRVNGTLRVDTLGAAGSTTLCRNAGNQISSCSSSARYKHDIGDLELGLAAALRLHAVGYRWKDTGAADIGFLAEEVAKIDARLVTRNAEGEIEGVKYERLTAVLANAVQELAARDSLATERLARIEAENAALRAESAEFRSRLDRLESLLADRMAGGR